MYGISSGYLVMLVFLTVAAGLTAVETFWLGRRAWAGVGKAFAFSLISIFTGIVISLTAFFVLMMFMLMMTWDGNNKREFPMGPTGENIAAVTIVIFVFLLLIAVRRLLMRIFGFPAGKFLWTYAIASTLLIGVALTGFPGIVVYLLNKA